MCCQWWTAVWHQVGHLSRKRAPSWSPRQRRETMRNPGNQSCHFSHRSRTLKDLPVAPQAGDHLSTIRCPAYLLPRQSRNLMRTKRARRRWRGRLRLRPRRASGSAWPSAAVAHTARRLLQRQPARLRGMPQPDDPLRSPPRPLVSDPDPEEEAVQGLPRRAELAVDADVVQELAMQAVAAPAPHRQLLHRSAVQARQPSRCLLERHQRLVRPDPAGWQDYGRVACEHSL